MNSLSVSICSRINAMQLSNAANAQCPSVAVSKHCSTQVIPLTNIIDQKRSWSSWFCLCVACPRDSFKDVPGNCSCVQCGLDRVTAHSGSSSRLDCQCVNSSCAAGILYNYDLILLRVLYTDQMHAPTTFEVQRRSNPKGYPAVKASDVDAHYVFTVVVLSKNVVVAGD